MIRAPLLINYKGEKLMTNKLKVKKVEAIPRRYKAVKLTKKNIADVAEWIGSTNYEIHYDASKNPRTVKFHIPNRNPVQAYVGGHVVRLVSPLAEYDETRFYGTGPNDYDRDYRKGWS
jgi:hypothetical protein